MFTELPTLLSSSHTYASHLSPQELRWRLLPLPSQCPKQAGGYHRQSLELEHLPELLENSLRLQAILSREAPEEGKRRTQLQDLPEEIQQGVLDILMGMLNSTSSSGIGRSHGMRNWSNAMRHPRGRHHSDLALVSPTWRRMIQERLYRHGKIENHRVKLSLMPSQSKSREPNGGWKQPLIGFCYRHVYSSMYDILKSGYLSGNVELDSHPLNCPDR